MAKLLLCLFVLVAACSAFPNWDITKPYLPWKRGTCLKNIGLDDFKPKEFFTGHWYEASSFGNYLLQADGICTALESEIRGDEIRTLYYQYEPIMKKYLNFRSQNSLNDIVGSSFNLNYDLFVGLAVYKVPFSVVATDYDNYSVLYSCQEAFGFKAEMAWVMTRERGDNSHEANVKQAVSQTGMNYDDFIPQTFTGCGPNEPTL